MADVHVNYLECCTDFDFS